MAGARLSEQVARASGVISSFCRRRAMYTWSVCSRPRLVRPQISSSSMRSVSTLSGYAAKSFKRSYSIGHCQTGGSTKFLEGAWVVLLLLPTLIWLMYRVREHYVAVARELMPAGGFLPPPHAIEHAIVFRSPA